MNTSVNNGKLLTGMVSPFVAPWRNPANEARIGFLIKSGDLIPRVDLVKDWAMGSGEPTVTRLVPTEDKRAGEDYLVVMDRLLAQGPSCVTAVIPTKAILMASDPSPFSKLGIPKKIMTEVEALRWSNTLQCLNNFGHWNEKQFHSEDAQGFHDSLRSIVFTARLIREGDMYGLNDSLIHAGDPMVEFYDQRNKQTEYGQFVSRYFVESLFGSNDPAEMSRNGGLCLEGSANSWNLSEKSMMNVMDWAAERLQQRQSLAIRSY